MIEVLNTLYTIKKHCSYIFLRISENIKWKNIYPKQYRNQLSAFSPQYNSGNPNCDFVK